jgi:hypothetical protein
MQGIVLDLSASQIYLEVDEQIRFRSPWITKTAPRRLHVRDRVDFAFTIDHGKPCVIIQSVQPILRSKLGQHN